MVDEKKNSVSFKDTLNLPTTSFPIRPQPAIDDPTLIERWAKEDLYTKTFQHNDGNPKFILHDGPPYANGHIHLGHAYNKILKDVICKSQRMSGKHVPITPGWDCHGLPIEIKVTKENPELTGLALIKACREYAQQWVNVQASEFKKLGVLMNWAHPYLTMSPSYESAIMRAFGTFVHDGYIDKKKKTVPWCPHDQTVLATAEIEYQERKDPSLYVTFELLEKSAHELFPQIKNQKIYLLIWTTTPWTLPLNRALMIRPKAVYQLIKLNEKYIVVGKELVDKIVAMVDGTKEVIAEVHSDQFINAKAQHPFIADLQVPIIESDSVLMTDGTAFVHCAPGCGPEDYEVGLRNNLEIFSPISTDGRYLIGIEPKELEGMPVADGQIWVIKKLAQNGNLFFKSSIKHNYPHCWRCHNPLIFRATNQWFCNLSHGNLKQRALQAIETISFLPERTANYLKATVEGRLEWCLSRQRQWGVPIPAVVCTECDHAFISHELVEFVANGVEKQGIEYWLEVPTHELPLPAQCQKCGGKAFNKERDILDVWFDSGVSHYAVLLNSKELAFPADIYCEGIDQHRGWFQSSLLTSLVLEKEAAMKSIVTHGFTVDQKGHKMSKSLGNVVAPEELIAQLGTDGLRLWVSSIDYAGDAIVSKELISNVGEVYRKIRNTCRFLLSNLYDFDIQKDVVPLEQLQVLDHYTLEYLYEFNIKVRASYEDVDLTAVFHALGDYCAKELSSFYLDIIKDRLYVQKADGIKRRSAQTVCWYILDTLTKLMAPVLSFTAELISDEYQKDKNESIHLQSFNDLQVIWDSLIKRSDAVQGSDWYPLEGRAQQAVEKIKQMSLVAERTEQWQLLISIRNAILKPIERQRELNIIKHSLEASLSIYFDFDEQRTALINDFINELNKSGQTLEEFFKEFLIVSQINIQTSPDGLEESELKGLYVRAEHAQGNKCPRCWHWDTTDHEHHLCTRCQKVLK